MLLAFAANAQTYNVHMKNGEVVKYNSSSVDYVDFSTSGTAIEAIDLGLPSGTLWANMNVGATSPEDYGDYFAWGEPTPKSVYKWNTYKLCNGDYNTLTKYCYDSNYGYNGYTDTKTVLDAEDDAATANWGGEWRMPTNREFEELLENTTSEWTTVNNVGGYRFTGTNGNSIFLPAAGSRWDGELSGAGSYGLYWSSSLGGSNPSRAWYLYFDSEYVYTYYYLRESGRSVRPVRQN